METKRYAIIVAGGVGKRMNSDIPKQFIELNGLPVLMHTISTFSKVNPKPQIVVVLPQEQIITWQNLCANHRFTIEHTVVAGGSERFFSVQNGLKMVDDTSALVAIHDGVRPLVSQQIIDTSFSIAAQFGTAIPVIKPVESVRIIDNKESKAFPRNKVLLVQTPQTFMAEILLAAYAQDFDPNFTDDASVVEAIGQNITTFLGERNNLKITTHLDLSLATAIMQSK